MTTQSFRALSAFALISIAAGSSSLAAVTFTNQTNFTAALTTGFFAQNYQSISTGGHVTPWNFAGGAGNAFSYTASTPAQAFLVFDIASNRYLTTSGRPTTQWSAPITFTFTGAPVYAVGGSFFFTSAGGSVVGGTVSISVNGSSAAALTGQTNTTFWGIISNSPITSLVITPDATHRFVSVDNFTVGTSSIPTPGAAALGVVGLLCVASQRRRSIA